MAPTSFTHRELSIATRLGIDRDWITAHRTQDGFGTRWTIGANRSYLWSDAGVDWLADQLQKNAAPASPDGATARENGAPPSDAPPAAMLPEKAVSAPAVLTVVRCNFINTRVLHALTPSGRIVTVTGVHARSWWPGFLMLAREHSPDVWEFEGNPDRQELGRRQPKGRTDNAWPRKPIGGAPASAA